jgi:hypothetical protein
MTPVQQHFRLAGWSETTIVVRFCLFIGIFVDVQPQYCRIALSTNYQARGAPRRGSCDPSSCPIRSSDSVLDGYSRTIGNSG